MGEEQLNSPTYKTYTEVFYKSLPYYLIMGMSVDEFWNGEPLLAKCFREKHKLSTNDKNESAWLNGLYFNIALNTVLSNAFSKNSTAQYPQKPIEFEKSDSSDKPIENLKEYNKARDLFSAWALAKNHQMKKGGGEVG